MGLAELRDLSIVIYATLGIVATIIVITLAIILFRKVTPIINSTRGTIDEIKGTSSILSSAVVKPVVKVVGFAAGIRKAIWVITKLSRRKGEKEGE